MKMFDFVVRSHLRIAVCFRYILYLPEYKTGPHLITLFMETPFWQGLSTVRKVCPNIQVNIDVKQNWCNTLKLYLSWKVVSMIKLDCLILNAISVMSQYITIWLDCYNINTNIGPHCHDCYSTHVTLYKLLKSWVSTNLLTVQCETSHVYPLCLVAQVGYISFDWFLAVLVNTVTFSKMLDWYLALERYYTACFGC